MQQVLRTGFSLDQRQTLTMNAQMIQALKLMDLPLLDLREKIVEELEKNPALEIVKDNSIVSLDTALKNYKTEKDYVDSGWDSPIAKGSRSSGSTDERRQFIEGVLTQDETLQEHLLWQFRLQPITEDIVRSAGEYLIQNINGDGFFLSSPDTFFDKNAKNSFTKKTIKKALQIIYSLDPMGCCTLNYVESLSVQAKIKFPKDAKLISAMIPYLEQLERGKFADAARALGEDKNILAELYEDLKTLNPFPGRQFKNGTADDVRFVIPDIQVVRKEDEFSIFLNNEEIPVLGIHPYFLERQQKNKDENPNSSKTSSDYEHQFLNENLKEARWFMECINKRNHTLLRVTRAIVEFQRQFFVDGPKHLVPLSLRDIAGELKLHETTISRCANGKYVQTEWGIYPLRYFFTNSISGSGSTGSEHSQASVKEVLREIIAEEKEQLSDNAISVLLSERGINIARRTVAKYRKQLSLDSSYKR
ncbi:MAG: RNA polymerase factor sigma-54 [Termitinemataceae bacterium]|nr:MAG: RNA polymerase factor sigma-54 [Termitinemataceae bacterium]